MSKISTTHSPFAIAADGVRDDVLDILADLAAAIVRVNTATARRVSAMRADAFRNALDTLDGLPCLRRVATCEHTRGHNRLGIINDAETVRMAAFTAARALRRAADVITAAAPDSEAAIGDFIRAFGRA